MVHGNSNVSGIVSKVNIRKNGNDYMDRGGLYRRFVFYSIVVAYDRRLSV